MAEIFAVVSGKGGVGKSTFTAGISKALASMGKRVLAVDCDIGLRSLDLLLDCDRRIVFDWGDGVSERCTPARTVISGEVDFIAAPRKMSDAYTAACLKKLLDEIVSGYDFVFADSPAGLGAGFEIAVGCADRLIAVTTPDSVCVRSCAIACEQAAALGLTDSRLIINMFESKPAERRRLLNLDDCVDETSTPLLGVIPMDRALAFAAVTGVQPDEFSPSSQAFYRIAKRLCGEKAELICE